METLPYLEFCLAQTRHQQAAHTLPDSERASLREAATRQWQLEERILCSEMAKTIPANPTAVKTALADIRMRYADQTQYLSDLAAHGLNEEILKLALARELCVDATLDAVVKQTPAITMEEAQAFYQAQSERFYQAEARFARHILITINEAHAENQRSAVNERMATLAETLRADPAQFAELALRHSECPSAMEEGKLGWVTRDKLYAELDAALFEMHEQEIRIVESELGLHLLYCETIRPAAAQSFADIADKLLASLQQRHSQRIQKEWIKGLMATEVC